MHCSLCMFVCLPCGKAERASPVSHDEVPHQNAPCRACARKEISRRISDLAHTLLDLISTRKIDQISASKALLAVKTF